MEAGMEGVVFGVGFAVVVAGIARALGPERGLMFMAVLLGAAAAVYVGASWAEPAASPALETAALVVFVALATLGRERARILAMGWLGHTAWDVLHLSDVLASSAPSWYMVGCLVADPLLAGFLVWWSLGERSARRSATVFGDGGVTEGESRSFSG